ncbi:MAG: hypothetical protein ACOC41_09010, partial [Chitinivibrionales bacterium]
MQPRSRSSIKIDERYYHGVPRYSVDSAPEKVDAVKTTSTTALDPVDGDIVSVDVDIVSVDVDIV